MEISFVEILFNPDCSDWKRISSTFNTEPTPLPLVKFMTIFAGTNLRSKKLLLSYTQLKDAIDVLLYVMLRLRRSEI